MPWPSTLSSFTDPNPSDKLSTTPHSSIETAQNTGLREVQAFVGTLSSAVGTLVYDIRAAASNGGGHVQTANKGGTGQTTYTKGDMLVATSSSVLAKLAVGTNDQAILADSAQAAGIKWGGVATATTIQNQTYTYARASVMSGSVFGVVLSQSPSVLTDGLGLVVKFPAVPTSSAMALQIHTTSSGSVAARIKKTNLADPATTEIGASMIAILEFDSVSSVFQLINPLPTAYQSSFIGSKTGDSGGFQSILSGATQAVVNSWCNVTVGTGNYVQAQVTLMPTGMTSQDVAFGEQNAATSTAEYNVNWTGGEIRASVMANVDTVNFIAYFYK